MVQEAVTALKKERDELLNLYVKAENNEKKSLLVKIIDIDEEIESFASNVDHPSNRQE